ncbi:threonine/serine dehydratase [Roseovarius sp. LXJ103]|uniref:threonine ammonia-lyase n=1 Tax=Roseovarius carneus TaxID=2853164 RepID=UPI000D6220F8|nr:threonine/serine dehydratase [Roseovarius carneus]MBZ8119728.1 threonine/serine dehydratase [Roseovarius carneus]PWE34666.1 threonine ammonia-lyase [Pelagicola sp. LXJ1103]
MNIERIRAAATRLAGHARQTPLLGSPFLDEIAGRRVLVKAECLQHTGSFKYRGGRAAVSALGSEVRARGVLAFSSGNHAQGVALAAREMGVPCVIIMPMDAPALKIANTRALGAEVILYDRAGGESREALGEAVRTERGMTLIKPYDEPEVIAGQGTTGLEIAAQAATMGIRAAEVLACCGGGGLTSGIAMALEADAPEMRVRPVEPEGFDDVARSLKSGQIESNEGPAKGLCDAILTPAPGEITFPIMQRLCAPGIVVSDDECLRAMALAWGRLKLVVEPGGAAALAGALFHNDSFEGDTVIATISGGNVDADVFQTALTRFGTLV